jgi:O-antigen/teichoic acid export membrane protein
VKSTTLLDSAGPDASDFAPPVKADDAACAPSPEVNAAFAMEAALSEPRVTAVLAEANAASAEPAWRTDSLAASLAILLVLSLAQRLIGFIRQVLVCRWLEPSQLGQWDIAFKFLLLAAPVTVLGLPGSFGRYTEHYRRRGQLRTLLRRTAAACILLCGVALVLMSGLRTMFSELIFGVADQTDMVLLLGVGLVCVVAYNFVTEMLTALRMVRVVSVVQFFNAVAFALLSVGFVFGWRRDASAIVAAYAGSSALLVVPTLFWFRRTWRQMPEPAILLSYRELGAKLIPFAVSVWIMNLLYNLVGLVDRYMIIHYARTSDPLALVGYYHSSLVVPALMISMAGLMSGILLPHLSHDWELGDRAAVSVKLNLALKLLGLSTFTISALVLLASPLLFGVLLEGKYTGGQEILPWTLTYCVWMSLVPVAQMYMWCAERARMPSLALLAGLAVNILLCGLLLPRFGLHGVAWATSAANLLGLGLILLFNHWLGMRLDRGTLLITLLLPMALGAGPLVATSVLVIVGLQLVTGERLLNAGEKSQLVAIFSQYVRKFLPGKFPRSI